MRSKSPLMERPRSAKVRPASTLPPAYGGSQCLDDIQQEPEDVATASDGLQGLLPEVLRTRFADLELEKLYRLYLVHSKRDYLVLGVVTCILLNVVGVVLSAWQYTPTNLPHLICMGVFLCANILLVLLIHFRRFSYQAYAVLSVTTWFYIIAQLYVDIALGRAPVTPSSGLGWQLYLGFTLYLMLAMRLRWCLVLSITSCVLHTLLVTVLPHSQGYGSLFAFPNVVAANLLLFLCATLLGCLGHFFADRSQRRAFLETKVSLGVSLGIEQSSQEQERLLLSVLPRHVAQEMIRDLGGEEAAGQFRKIYMSRHENVSILFADIVGFTALSSKVTPHGLVKILNDLFATFDKLAHTYHQLRIKILGDCYYCICGCPVPRPDHAVLAIHMGLTMVDAISEVRKKTQSGVNMRVGIHTGSVLGGVLGQNRWQYDVLGKEVTLANHMESGGVAGRVHISEATAGFLMGEFELEPGDGESRDEAIKQAGIKTHLIKSVMQPYPEGTLDAEGSLKTKQMLEAEEESVGGEQGAVQAYADSMDRLKDALLDREQTVNLKNKVHLISLRFNDVSTEREFNKLKHASSGPVLVAMCIVGLCTFLSHLCILPRNIIVAMAFILSESVLVVMVTLTMANIFPKAFPRVLVRFADWYNATLWFRSLYIIVIVVIMIMASLLDRYGCSSRPHSKTAGNETITASVATWRLEPGAGHCDYPAYFLHFPVLVVCALLLMTQISYAVKMILMVVIVTVICVVDMVVLASVHDEVDDIVFHRLGLVPALPARSRVVLSAGLIAFAVSLCIFSRLNELYDRKLFFYRREVDDMRRQVDAITQKNESLIYNLLPAHVAKDFIGSRRTDEELYSQAYDEVGVMFASCPNFHDHYTEDAVNNDGLEWMRFLNEILSDYDDLLNEPRFRNVIKIKTIGPTYMAASGMNLDTPAKGADAAARWQHLADLVEFALGLKEALDRINSQSFNNFMLRVGINHGPVLAGVIGARKPHYDIWGNAVNVASRMESTGQLGKIQVVQPTMELLQEFGYKFEKRGLVKVKGKGELMTYFLSGRDQAMLPNQVAPF